MTQSKFTIAHQTPACIYIKDTGKEEKSVTNDAAAVCAHLSEHHELGARRLIYCDSSGQIDEILHDNGKFKGFAPGHSGINDPYLKRQIKINKLKKLTEVMEDINTLL